MNKCAIKIVACIDHDTVEGISRRRVDWNLPEYKYKGVININVILDRLNITPKDGECFELSIRPVATEAAGEEER